MGLIMRQAEQQCRPSQKLLHAAGVEDLISYLSCTIVGHWLKCVALLCAHVVQQLPVLPLCDLHQLAHCLFEPACT